MQKNGKPGNKSLWVAPIVLLTVVMLFWPGVMAENEDPGVNRGLPERGLCGDLIEVTLTVTAPDGTDGWFVIEDLPEQVMLEDVGPAYDGVYDEERHRITWVSMNGTSATLSYALKVDLEPGQEQVLEFAGEYRFDPHMDGRLETTGNLELHTECINLPGEKGEQGMVRSLPATARCGDTVQVAIAVQSGAHTRAWALEEAPPRDVEVLDWTRDLHGDYNEATHLLKWLSLSADTSVLTYEIKIPEEMDGGTVLSFDSEKRFMPQTDDADTVLGDDTLTVRCGNWRTLALGGGVAATALGLGFLVWRVRRPGQL